MSDCSIPFNVKGKVFRKLVVLEKATPIIDLADFVFLELKITRYLLTTYNVSTPYNI